MKSWKYLATPWGVAVVLAIVSGIAAEFAPPGTLKSGFHGATGILVTAALVIFCLFGWGDMDE